MTISTSARNVAASPTVTLSRLKPQATGTSWPFHSRLAPFHVRKSRSTSRRHSTAPDPFGPAAVNSARRRPRHGDACLPQRERPADAASEGKSGALALRGYLHRRAPNGRGGDRTGPSCSTRSGTGRAFEASSSRKSTSPPPRRRAGVASRPLMLRRDPRAPHVRARDPQFFS